jgi:hypothetical protein
MVLEFPVDTRLGPYLVSKGAAKSEATLWLRRSHGGKVRAAPRDTTLSEWFAEVISAVTDKSREEGWGNVQRLSKEGIKKAIAHVEEYGLKDLLILAHPDTDWPSIDAKWVVAEGDLPMALLGLPLQPAVWLDPHVLVVVPKDRSFVGFAQLIDQRIVSVVHNACRGLGIARADQEPMSD